MGRIFDRECSFWMRPGIDLFLPLLFFHPVFLFCGWRVFLTKNGVFWLKGVVGPKRVVPMTLHLLSFILVCYNLRGSLFGPNHPS